LQRPSFSGEFRFVTTGMGAAFGAIGQAGVIDVALAVVVALGGAFAWRQRQRSKRLSQLAVPVALLGGSIVFFAITGSGRLVLGTDTARASRYLHLAVAMMLPALAIAADALTTRWRWFLPIAIAMFFVGLPGNLRAFDDARRFWSGPYAGTRQEMVSLAQDPLARQVPRSLRPDRHYAEEVTVGWLLDAVAQHRFPTIHVSKSDLRASHFRLSFDQQRTPPPTTSCVVLRRPLDIVLRKGDTIGLSDLPVLVTSDQGNRFVNPTLRFSAGDGVVVVLRDVGRVHMSAAITGYPSRICTGVRLSE